MNNEDAGALLTKYFPDIEGEKVSRLIKLSILYNEWNPKVNLISRKDMDNIISHHILHALAIAKFNSFKPNTTILDLGTGGGLPGVPLAIIFPQSKFHLVDARAKKIAVVQDIIERLKLSNVTAEHKRVETLKSKYEFIVSRAVTSLQQLLEWSSHLISNEHRNAIPNGYILLKGGDLSEEIRTARAHKRSEIEGIDQWFDDPWYVGKKILYVPK